MRRVPRVPAPHAMRAACLLACLALIGCGGTGPRESAGGVIPPDHPRAALLPFENLAGREELGALYTKVFFAQIASSGALDMIEPGRVDVALDSLGLRPGETPTPGQLRALGDTLGAPYLLLGSILESGRIQTAGGEVPAQGATLRLVEAATGRVLWAGVHFRSGEDRETVFGWGRETSAERLVSKLAFDMLHDFRAAGAVRTRRERKEERK